MRTTVVIFAAAIVAAISTESFADLPLMPGCLIRNPAPAAGPENPAGELESLGAVPLIRGVLDPMAGDEPYDRATGANPRVGETGHSKAGAIVGFGVGFAVGLTTGLAAGDDFIMSANSKGLFLGLVMGALGAGIGGTLGGLVKGDHSEGVSLGSGMPRLGLETRGGDVRLALAY